MGNTMQTAPADTKTDADIADAEIADADLDNVSGGAKPWEREPTPGFSDTATFTVTTRREK